MSTLHLTAQIRPEDDAFIAHRPELEVTSQGDSFEHAMAMIKEAVELTLSDLSPGTLPEPRSRYPRYNLGQPAPTRAACTAPVP
jgi:predicted RNase H-like HicB family nuclease